MQKIIRVIFILLIIVSIFLIGFDMIFSYRKESFNNKKVEEFFEKDDRVYDLSKNTHRDNDFFGILEIPKIGLKRGFVNPVSTHNNIGENITILKPILMPDEENSTFIIAAHSGNSHISYFKNLHRLNIDDMVYVYYKNIKYEYKIGKYYEEDKNGRIRVDDDFGNKRIVLTTCKSFNKQLVYIGYLYKEYLY